MKKNLPIKKQDTSIILHKSQSLRSITQKILTQTPNLPQKVIEEWVQEILLWADENGLPELEWVENAFSDDGYWCGVPRKVNELINVKELGLSQFQISELPKEIGKLSNLSSLWLTENNLTTLPKEIGDLIGLKKLSLLGNKLESLPHEICNLIQLNELWLTGNPKLVLTSSQKEWLSILRENNCKIKIDKNIYADNTLISDDITDTDDFLQFLEEFDFELTEADVDNAFDGIDNYELSDEFTENNSVDSIGDDWMQRLWKWADDNGIPDYEHIKNQNQDYWGGLPRDKDVLLNLTDLSLIDYKITEVPKEIGNLVNLTELWLNGGNQLTVLPKEIGNLENLTILNLWGNQLTKLPKEIGNLTNLVELNLRNNLLMELPKEIGNLTKLVELDLGRNQLVKLPKEMENIINLTNLIVDYNPDLILTKAQHHQAFIKVIKFHFN